MAEHEYHDHTHQPGSPQWNKNLDKFMRVIRKGIRKNRFIIQIVSDGNPATDFVYTIGLTNYRLPELRLSQFHRDLSAELLWTVADDILKHHANQHDTVALASEHLVAAQERPLPVPYDGWDDITFGFARPNIFDDDRPLGMANRYYQRPVPYLDVTTPGWPCPRCAPMDVTKPCTCVFSCWWQNCAMLDDFQRSVHPDDYV